MSKSTSIIQTPSIARCGIKKAPLYWVNVKQIISFQFFFSSTETYLVTGLSLIAEIGGMAGLLLGVSFFHIAKLIGKSNF